MGIVKFGRLNSKNEVRKFAVFILAVFGNVFAMDGSECRCLNTMLLTNFHTFCGCIC